MEMHFISWRKNMNDIKKMICRPISSKVCNEFIKKHHYSGKVVNNSSLHLGFFLNSVLVGGMSFGPSLDKSKIIGLVENTGWNEFVELNRMAFANTMPKNTESRAIKISIVMIKKYAPHIKWIVTFADGTQCGDGTIYRASGFKLIGINESKNLIRLPSGEVIHKMTLHSNLLSPRRELDGKNYLEITNGEYSLKKYIQYVNGEIIPGFQLKYIKLIHDNLKLTVPEIPYSEILKRGAKMYLGKRVVDETVS